MTTRRWTCVCFLTCAAFLLAALTGAATQARPTPTGEWQGVLARLHLTLKIDQGADAVLNGSIVVAEQGNAVVPIDAVSVGDDGSIWIDFKAIGASFEGKLAADGMEMAGEWKQGGGSIPLVFRRPGAGPAAFTLKPTRKGSIALAPCRTTNEALEALCGTHEVYENRSTRAGRKIALGVMIIPARASTPDPDPFFALAGGPGQSATDTFPQTGFVRALTEQRDVVLVDQRGTGKSNPLDCALISTDNPQDVLGSPYSLDKIRRCRADSDRKADTTQYTTSNYADDLDEVRAALGYDRINLFGGSYGSKAALVYLRRHGEHVRTVALEQVAPPDFLIPLPFAKGVQSAADGVIALCEADAACRKAYPDLRRQYRAISDHLAQAPAQFDLNGQHVTLSREMFVSKLRSVLYVPQFISLFPLVVQQASDGDWTTYAALLMRMTAAVEGGIARGASFAVICAEDVPATTPARIQSATAGTDMGDSQARRYEEYCKAWGPAGSAPKDFYAAVRSNVPALLISGALDPGTPPEWASDAVKTLPNGRLISIKEGTHGTGSSCVDGLIAEFVKRGAAKDMDTSCVDSIHLPPFVIR